MAVEDALKLLAAILAATVLAVNLSIVRPLKDRMEELKREVADMQSEVQLLVGERDQVRSTNDLLTGLKAQQAAFEDARHSLSVMRQLREDIASECQKTSEVLASVEKLAVLQQTVLRYRDLTEPATRVLNDIVGIEKQLVDQNLSTDDAIDATNRLVVLKRNLVTEAADTNAADAVLAQLVNLKAQVLAQGEDLSTANSRAKLLFELKDEIVEKTNDLDVASSAVDGLLSMKDQLVVRGGQIADARQNAERLLGLRDRLAENPIKTEAAERTANRMLEIQKKLAGQNPNLAESIKAIETLIDVQREFQKQIRSLDGMRRGLMEFVLMENTVARAVRMLQPLLELGNLRHMDEEQLRQIARSIAENQSTRVSKNEPAHSATRTESSLGPSQYNRDMADPTASDDSVPWPTEPE